MEELKKELLEEAKENIYISYGVFYGIGCFLGFVLGFILFVYLKTPYFLLLSLLSVILFILQNYFLNFIKITEEKILAEYKEIIEDKIYSYHENCELIKKASEELNQIFTDTQQEIHDDLKKINNDWQEKQQKILQKQTKLKNDYPVLLELQKSLTK